MLRPFSRICQIEDKPVVLAVYGSSPPDGGASPGKRKAWWRATLVAFAAAVVVSGVTLTRACEAEAMDLPVDPTAVNSADDSVVGFAWALFQHVPPALKPWVALLLLGGAASALLGNVVRPHVPPDLWAKLGLVGVFLDKFVAGNRAHTANASREEPRPVGSCDDGYTCTSPRKEPGLVGSRK